MNLEYLNEIPIGYKIVKNTQTNPLGFNWYSNGKSRFSGKRISVLVKNKESD